MGSRILQPRDILALIELIYFVPVLVAAVLVCNRHGFGKGLGWFSMIMLACFRISATTTFIAASYDNTVTGLVTASIILSKFGLASILVSLQGLLVRLSVTYLPSGYGDSVTDLHLPYSNKYLPDHRRVHPRVYKFAHLLTSVGVGLALAGAIELGDSSNGNDAQGRTLSRIAIILFVVLWIILFTLNTQSFAFQSRIVQSERPIFTATSTALLLIAPRLLFALLAVYQVDTRVFNSLSQGHTAVVVSAVFVTLPEFIIAAVILRAGFKVPCAALQRKHAMEA